MARLPRKGHSPARGARVERNWDVLTVEEKVEVLNLDVTSLQQLVPQINATLKAHKKALDALQASLDALQASLDALQTGHDELSAVFNIEADGSVTVQKNLSIAHGTDIIFAQ
jgi:hypothetical protein